ncbi:MAG: hypothetical protein J6A97_01905 [Clostridia bacterium]|nr:hypothetical protein [Clostridia bacterium]
MTAVLLIAIFLFASWIGLVIAGSPNDAAQLSAAAVLGCTVVLVVTATMILKRLDVIIKDLKLLKEKDKKETKTKGEPE